MDDQRIRLILDLGNSGKSVAEIREELDRLGASAKETAETYEVLSTVVARSSGVVGTYDIAIDKANVELDEMVRKAVEATQAQKAMGSILDESSRKFKLNGRAALETGRFLQDFAQGGIGGVMNNIEGLTTALGGGPGLAGIMTAVGLAAYFAKPHMDKLFESFGPLKEKIPEATDKLERLTESIKRDKEELDELRKKRELDYWDMQRYTEGVDRLKAREDELALAREARKVGPGQSKANRERAAAFEEAVQEHGGDERLIEGLQLAGKTEKEAESMVIDARRGVKGAAERIQQATSGLAANSQFGYISPETRRRRQLQTQQTQAILDRNRDRIRDEQASRRAEIEAEATTNLNELDRSNAEYLANKKQAAAAKKRAAAQAKQKAAAAKRAPGEQRRHEHEAHIQQANALIHSPESVQAIGEAFGPRAAMAAANASPNELHELTEGIVRNLDNDMFPRDALLDSFRRIFAASERRAQENQQFRNDLNGVNRMQGRMMRGLESPPVSSGMGR